MTTERSQGGIHPPPKDTPSVTHFLQGGLLLPSESPFELPQCYKLIRSKTVTKPRGDSVTHRHTEVCFFNLTGTSQHNQLDSSPYPSQTTQISDSKEFTDIPGGSTHFSSYTRAPMPGSADRHSECHFPQTKLSYHHFIPCGTGVFPPGFTQQPQAV